MMINKEDLKDTIEEKYGDLSNNCGCYINSEWLSISDIIEIVDNCTEYDS